eukprot:3277672-Heterocapsa_arctica.AAC.1
MKGRCVFQGGDVRDENHQTVIFQELSSSPATLGAAKSVDAFGLLLGHDVEQCNVQQAYVQSKLGGYSDVGDVAKDSKAPRL